MATKAALTFLFRGRKIPVTHGSISPEVAALALDSEVFGTWKSRCERENDGKQLELHSVEIQNVDLFGPR